MAGIIAVITGIITGCTVRGRHEAGGTTDKTEPNAPKVINSKELTYLETDFRHNSRWSAGDDHRFIFELSEDETGAIILKEKERNISVTADQALMNSVQDIIDNDKLVQSNGIYRVTAGLPPEYQPCYFEARYASGEKISFTVNNDPYARWSADLYDLFADYFSRKGTDALYPEKETALITKFWIKLTENGYTFEYCGMDYPENMAIEGQTHMLMRRVYEQGNMKTAVEDRMPFPDGYYEKISQIISDSGFLRSYDFSCYNYESSRLDNHETGYYGMGDKTAADNEADSDELMLFYQIDYDNGRAIRVKTKKPSEIEGMRAFTEALRTYHDELFEKLPHETAMPYKK